MPLFEWWRSRRALQREGDELRPRLASFARMRAMLRGSGGVETPPEGPFRALVQHASDFIAIVNNDGTIRYKSPSITRIFGYRTDDMRERQVLEFVHPEDAPAVL